MRRSFFLALLGIAIPATFAAGVVPPECTPAPVLATTTDRLGATHYRYPGGIEQVVPPASFDPRTAPDADLERYGFDARPTDPASLAAWQHTYANWSGFAVGFCMPRHPSSSVG